MKKIPVIVVASVAVALFLPLSNMLGLTPANEPIAPVPNTSVNFAKVSQIFQNKCVDCHSPGMTRMPIYAELPIAKQLMASDIKNASARFLITKAMYSGESPFTPLMLARLEGVLRNNTMPPLLYLSMHWNENLNQSEKSAILAWIGEERAKLAGNEVIPEFKGEPVQPLSIKANLDADKIALGKQLFFDFRLSGDNMLNCASCHSLAKGGTDQAKVATGIRGQQGPINSPSVYNAGYNIAQFWDGRAKDLVEQASGPVANPGEMGADWNHVIETLNQVEAYRSTFNTLYPEQGLTQATVTQAIAAFEESLVTTNSRFDHYLHGRIESLSDDEKQGYELFKDHCASCHFGPSLGGQSFEKMGHETNYFQLRGGPLTEADNGRFNVSKQEADRHLFKVPNLRNVEITYPYFHDGSVATLKDAVRIMARVQRGKILKDDEAEKIVAFLKTLTGEYQGKALNQLQEADFKRD
ncbi:MAG: cytochrome c peroxidase [Methylobacter sp.]